MVDSRWSDPDVLEDAIILALKDRNIEAVGQLLRSLALCDPRRAQRMYEDLQTALHVAQGGNVRVRLEAAP